MRAFFSLCLLCLLAILTQKANSACDPITVVNNLPDTVKVGFGGKLDLSAEFSATDVPVDTCLITTMNWEARPNGGSPYSVTGTPIAYPDTGTAYTISWRPANAETLRLTPYLVDSLANVYTCSDTTVVIVKDGLWYPEAFHYRGCFRVRDNDGTGGNSFFSYKGGSMMAYCPDGEAGDTDGYDGSLFMNGWMVEEFGPNLGGEVAQMTIPEPVISTARNLNQLNTAQYIQNFAPIFGTGNTSWASYAGNTPKCGDLFYIPASGGLPRNTLYFTFRDTYAVDADYYSLGRCPSDFNNDSPQGLWHLGALGTSSTNPYNFRSWANYLFAAPPDWRYSYLGGKWLIAGMGDREAGTNGASRGPTIYAFNPLFADRQGCNSTGGGSNPDTSKIPVLRLLQYQPNGGTGGDTSCDSTYGTQRAHYDVHRGYDRENDYSLTDAWHGGAWLWHNNKQSLVFSVTKCRYHSHYYQPPTTGHPEGLICGGYPCPGVDNNSGWTCGDSTSDPPAYRTALWFYDPDDIKDVLLGFKQPYDPQPYAALSLTDFQWDPSACTATFRDMAYDDVNGRLYISEPEADAPGNNHRPLIHVFDITPWESYLVSFDISRDAVVHVGDSAYVALTWDLQTTADCTFATDSTSVASVEVVVADSTFSIDSAPLVNGSTALYEANIPCPTFGLTHVRGRLTIDAPGTDCDGVFDTPIKTVFVQLNP